MKQTTRTIFRLSALSFVLLTPLSPTKAQMPEPDEAKPVENALIDLEKLPQELLSKPFQASSRIVVQLDGSEEAEGIERHIETINQLVYINPENWRALREVAYPKSRLEVLQSPEGSFQLTETNRKISSEKTYPPEFWVEIVLSAFELSRKWSLLDNADDFESWLKAIQNDVTEELKNAEGDSLKVIRSEDKKVKRTQVVLDGSILHNGKTKVQIRMEWTLETGASLTDKDLQKSLKVGVSN